MKVNLYLLPESIEISSGENNSGVLSDLFETISEGQSFLGHSYESLQSLGNGWHELTLQEAMEVVDDDSH